MRRGGGFLLPLAALMFLMVGISLIIMHKTGPFTRGIR